MTDEPIKGSRKDAHYARLRRDHRSRNPASGPRTDAPPEGQLYLYGLHTVRAALDNPRRTIRRLWATPNAAARLGLAADRPFPVETVRPADLDRRVGKDAVHQGVVLLADALKPVNLSGLDGARLVIVLDQVTDPHNVGALMRSGVAMAAEALITTARHSPAETGVLAKAASGALEQLAIVQVRNLAEAIDALNTRGFQTIGLDSDGEQPLEAALRGDRIALVLGSEGKGLRQKTRATVTNLARLDLPGAIKSLNVSNAAVLALYIARQHLSADSAGQATEVLPRK